MVKNQPQSQEATGMNLTIRILRAESSDIQSDFLCIRLKTGSNTTMYWEYRGGKTIKRCKGMVNSKFRLVVICGGENGGVEVQEGAHRSFFFFFFNKQNKTQHHWVLGTWDSFYYSLKLTCYYIRYHCIISYLKIEQLETLIDLLISHNFSVCQETRSRLAGWF